MSSSGPPATSHFVRTPTPNRSTYPSYQHLQRYATRSNLQHELNTSTATQTPMSNTNSQTDNSDTHQIIVVDDEIQFKANTSMPSNMHSTCTEEVPSDSHEFHETPHSVLRKSTSESPSKSLKNIAGIKLRWDVDGELHESEEEDEQIKEMHAFATALALSNRESMQLKKIGTCDGLKADQLLKWLRNIDIMRDPIETARATAIGPLGLYLQKQTSCNWAKIRSAIANHFISGAFQQQQRDAMFSTSQRAGESLTSFNYEFEALVKEGYDSLPEDQTDLIRAYLSALHNRKMALAVLNKKPQSLEEAMRMATERDKANDFLKPRGGRVALLEEQSEDRFGKHLDALTKTVDSLAQMQINLASQVAQVTSANAAAPAERSRRCYRCDQPGHLARECTTPPRAPERPHNQRQNNSGVTMYCERCKRDTHNVTQCRAGPPNRPCFCGERHWAYDCPRRNEQVPQRNSHASPHAHRSGTLEAAAADGPRCGGRQVARPHVKLNLNGLQVNALIDTGSTHTIVNSHIYRKLPRLTPLRIHDVPKLTSITNHELPVRGSCSLNIAGRPVDVTICDNLGVDLLIGTDLCHDAIIDFKKGTFAIGDYEFPFRIANNDTCPVMSVKLIPQAPHDVINSVLASFSDVFSHKNTPVGASHNLPPCVIDTGDQPPIRQRAYRMPFSKRQECERLVQEMLRDGIIRESNSPWASPVTLVEKRDKTTRFCIDYRRLNAITRKNSYPVPLVQDVFDAMAGAKIFSTMDLRSGYHQLKMAPDSIPKTAFLVPSGLYEFLRMPFGLTAAPAIFQKTMDKVLAGLGIFAKVFIDDIVVWSKTPEEHALHLKQVFERLRSAGLQLKTSKCHFGLDEVELLGHSVSAKGVRPLESRVEAIKNLGPPDSVKPLRSFLGMASYYRSHIPHFSDVALPLTELTKAKAPFIWGPEQQKAFDALKNALVKAPILAHPNVNKPYILYTDASNAAVGAILVQKDDEGVERVICYVSNKLAGPQLRWSTIEKEAYAIVNALKRLHAYLWGAKFEIHTDHSPLRSLFQSEIKSSKLARWSIQIQEFGAPILYCEGKRNFRADFLSRIAAIQPKQRVPKTPFQIFAPLDVPDVWLTDKIDPNELAALQQQQFPNEYAEATQDNDESSYVIENGLLYSNAEPRRNMGRYLRLILPQQYREGVINRCHSEVGHSAFAKTISRVQENYVWPGMRRHIREYIKHCVLCNTLTPPFPAMPRGMVPTPPRAFHSWAVDLIGPMPRDRRGRSWLLTAVDLLTGWCEAIPIASKHSDTVQEAFLTNVVARYGIPVMCLSDNGGEFTGEAFESWLREFGVEHRFTSPGNPSCNGMCERLNGTIQKLLLKLTGGNPRKWSQYLPEALYAYRITAGPGGISPYQAVYGQKPRLPRSSVNSQEEGDRLRAIRLAEKLLHEYRCKQKEAYVKKEPKHAKRLPPGTFVTLRALNTRKGESPWKPGYQVMSSHDGALRVVELATGRIIRVNQRNVREVPESKPYEEVDPRPQNPKTNQSAQPEMNPAAALPPIPVQENPYLPTHVPTNSGNRAGQRRER